MQPPQKQALELATAEKRHELNAPRRNAAKGNERPTPSITNTALPTGKPGTRHVATFVVAFAAAVVVVALIVVFCNELCCSELEAQ